LIWDHAQVDKCSHNIYLALILEHAYDTNQIIIIATEAVMKRTHHYCWRPMLWLARVMWSIGGEQGDQAENESTNGLVSTESVETESVETEAKEGVEMILILANLTDLRYQGRTSPWHQFSLSTPLVSARQPEFETSPTAQVPRCNSLRSAPAWSPG
jgi:hypothetical protein